ncbi:MAG: insulinase family protein [Planctomycetes bacterium]|nr:insulinase family protein [Planctomycetota bacterium]
MNKRVLSLLTVLLASAVATFAQAPAEPKSETSAASVDQILVSKPSLTVVRLSNDMTVIVRPLRTTSTVHVQSYVKTGGIYESQWLGAGISHLTEHLVAMGAEHDRDGSAAKDDEAKAQRDDRISRIGGQSNAGTSLDYTTYYISALSTKAGECIDLICEWMARPTFTEADFTREHGVVQRELELGKDSPGRMLWQAHASNAFGSHPAAVPVIGYAKPLAELTYDDVRQYHAASYVPQNMVIVIVGNVEADFAVNRVIKAIGPQRQGRTPSRVLPTVEPFAGVRRLILPNAKVKETTQYTSFQTIPLVHEDLYALDVLSYALTNGRSSRLVERLERQMLVTSISSSSWTPNWGKGLFTFTFKTAPDKADLAEQALMDEIAKVLADGITDQELLRAKRQKVADHVYSQQSAQSIADVIGMDFISTGDAEFSSNYTKRIQQVSAEDVLAVARKYLTPDAMVITRMTPAEQAAATGNAQTSQSPEQPARMITLPNGLRVILKSTSAVELVSMAMVTEGGLMIENDKTNGIGAAMAAMTTKGAGKRNALQIAEFFDHAGGGISGINGNNSFVWQSTVLGDQFDEALDIFADVILKPTFDDSELEILRPNLVQAIRRVDQELIPEAFKHARRLFFNDSPYRMHSAGDETVVASLKTEDLRKWHADHVRAGSSVLSIWGNFDDQAVEKRIVELFGAMPEGKNTLPSLAPVGDFSRQPQVVTTSNVGSAVVVYAPGTTLDNLEDCAAIDVLDTIISGYRLPSGWLHNRLRGRELVYVVHAANWAGLAPGAFMAYAACQPENAPQVVDIITKSLEEAAQYTPTQEEVDRAVNTILTADILDSQSMSELALNSALSELVGRGYNYLDRMNEIYGKVTPQEVRRVGEKYLGGGYFVVVTTNQPAVFGE